MVHQQQTNLLAERTIQRSTVKILQYSSTNITKARTLDERKHWKVISDLGKL